MPGIPIGNRVIAQNIYSNSATVRGRLPQFPAVLAQQMTPTQISTYKSAAVANGFTPIVIQYVVPNDMKPSLSAAQQQIITDNPQFVLRQAGVNGTPLVMTTAYGQMIMPAHARSRVNSAGKTYVEAFVDQAWIEKFAGVDVDGIYFDEFAPYIGASGRWTGVNAGTVVAGSTTTNIKTSGFPVVGTASWGRFKDDTTTAALRGVFFVANSSTATDIPIGSTLPATPAVGDTFEICTTLGALAGDSFTTLLADLFGDGTEHNTGSARATSEVLLVQSLGMRRAKELAIAAGKPNFIVTANYGPGSGRMLHWPQLIADGCMHGFGIEGFLGKSYAPTPRATLNCLNELVNRFGQASSNAFPWGEGYGNESTDVTPLVLTPKMRNAYSLAMQTDGWFCTGVYEEAFPADEFYVPLSIASAIDPPQNERQSGGYYLRRYTGGAAIYNPSNSTISNITVPGYKKFNAASYGNNDPTFNNGATTFNLPAMSGAILIPA